MAFLAARNGDLCSSTVLARTVNTNPVVIRRLLQDLRAARLVVTERGPGGGARLRRPARQITLAQIYAAVESPRLFGTHPGQPAKSCPVGGRIAGVLDRIFARADRAVVRELGCLTLGGL